MRPTCIIPFSLFVCICSNLSGSEIVAEDNWVRLVADTSFEMAPGERDLPPVYSKPGDEGRSIYCVITDRQPESSRRVVVLAVGVSTVSLTYSESGSLVSALIHNGTPQRGIIMGSINDSGWLVRIPRGVDSEEAFYFNNELTSVLPVTVIAKALD